MDRLEFREEVKFLAREFGERVDLFKLKARMAFGSPLNGLEVDESRLLEVKLNKRRLDRITMAEDKARFELERLKKPDIWAVSDPLVTVRIVTYNRPELLVNRAIKSVLSQTHRNLELIVVGDHASEETTEAVSRISDPRLRYFNLPARPTYPEVPRSFWYCAGVYAAIKACELAQGDWMTWLDDDDEYPEDHIEALLAEARSKRLELVYGNSEHQQPNGDWKITGHSGYRSGGFCSGSVLYSSRLNCVRHDPHCWILGEPGDWNTWRRFRKLGARIGYLNHTVLRHYMEMTMLSDDVDRNALLRLPPTPAQVIQDVMRTGAGGLLLGPTLG